MPDVSEQAMDARARRAAQRIGLVACKSRWRAGSVDNQGGFQIADPRFSRIEAGVRFDLSAQDVVAYCRD